MDHKKKKQLKRDKIGDITLKPASWQNWWIGGVNPISKR
jgi:hypothetical protein